MQITIWRSEFGPREFPRRPYAEIQLQDIDMPFRLNTLRTKCGFVLSMNRRKFSMNRLKFVLRCGGEESRKPTCHQTRVNMIYDQKNLFPLQFSPPMNTKHGRSSEKVNCVGVGGR